MCTNHRRDVMPEDTLQGTGHWWVWKISQYFSWKVSELLPKSWTDFNFLPPSIEHQICTGQPGHERLLPKKIKKGSLPNPTRRGEELGPWVANSKSKYLWLIWTSTRVEKNVYIDDIMTQTNVWLLKHYPGTNCGSDDELQPINWSSNDENVYRK